MRRMHTAVGLLLALCVLQAAVLVTHAEANGSAMAKSTKESLRHDAVDMVPSTPPVRGSGKSTTPRRSATSALPRLSDDPEKAALQRRYLAFFHSEGYKAEIDKDGDITLSREGSFYFVQLDMDDRQFFRLVYPNFWSIDNDQEREHALVAMDVANAETKVCKLYLQRDKMWASVEAFIAQPEAFKPVFGRMIASLGTCTGKFVRQMR